jgi:hypothetical protein
LPGSLAPSEAFVWLNPDGFVLGTTLFHPQELPTGAVDLFREATQRPAVGVPHVPARVRVASDAIAESLRRALAPDVEVVCAPTPELDEVATSMRAHFTEDAPRGERRLVPALTSALPTERVAAMFAASAALFRVQPWNVIPEEVGIFALDAPELGLADAVVSVMGGTGERRGLLVFETRTDFAAYLESALAMIEEQDDRLTQVGRHLFVDFFAAGEVSPEARKQIMTEGWPVASPQAYPSFGAADDDGRLRAATPRELAILELVTRAVASIFERAPDPAALVAALEAGRTVTSTYEGATLTVPHPHLLDDELVDSGDFDGADALAVYADFLRTPEGKVVSDRSWPMVLLNHAEESFGRTVDTLDGITVRKVLLEVLPRTVQCHPAEAAEIVRDLRSFFAFLERTARAAVARDCLRALADGFTSELHRALAER